MCRLPLPLAFAMTAIAALAPAVPAIEAGGGGGGCAPRPRDGANEPVVITGMCFTPAVLYVQPGATVDWQQQDATAHNVTLFDGELVGGSQALSPGDTVSRTFEAAGVFPYYCAIHPSMHGVIVVGDPAGPGFAANLALQSSGQRPTSGAEALPDKVKGSGTDTGTPWAEAAVAFGLIAALFVGLLAFGGGIKLPHRTR
jgi:plastocyanin